jgi:hypothetical protein
MIVNMGKNIDVEKFLKDKMGTFFDEWEAVINENVWLYDINLIDDLEVYVPKQIWQHHYFTRGGSSECY